MLYILRIKIILPCISESQHTLLRDDEQQEREVMRMRLLVMLAVATSLIVSGHATRKYD